MNDKYSNDSEKKRHESVSAGIQLLAVADAMTGGRFMNSLFPAPKLIPKSLCDSCARNFKEPSFCQSCIKTWYNTTNLIIKTCSGFKEIIT